MPDIDDRRAWQTVLAHVESRLQEGALAPGDRLPGERVLAGELGVGRSSVREAVRVLEAMGLVRTQTGSGPNAGAIIIATPHGAMGALMRLHVSAHAFPVADVVKTRLLLEQAVVATLADDPRADLSGARLLLDAMDDDALTPGEFLALDARFHVALASASGNEVVTAMMAGLRSSIEGYVLAGSAAIPDWPATAERLRREHRGVIDAIAGGDAATAGSRIRSHISGYYAETALTDSPFLPAGDPAHTAAASSG